MTQDKTRREVIRLMGVTAGVAAISPYLTGRAFAEKEKVTKIEPPWPYEKIKPKVAAERAYGGYYEAQCMYGAFWGIIGELAERRGAPYNTFPAKMLKYGAGGVAGWGSLCGALNGAAAAIYLVSPDPEPIVEELFGWHQEAKLPDYIPEKAKYNIVKSVARSELCHVSISNWIKVSGLKLTSKERGERCARITASVARHTVKLLNQQAKGKLKALYPISGRTKACRDCHDKGSSREDSRGKMDCTVCHFNLGIKHPAKK
jgi:hypothetical protein